MGDKNDFPGRKIINIHDDANYEEYDLDGPVQDEIKYIPASYDAKGDRMGVYVMRMDPGAVTVAHTHSQNEDFLILEGELIESDGTVLKAGDFVHYAPGTHHNSRTQTGCLLIGFDWTGKAYGEKER